MSSSDSQDNALEQEQPQVFDLAGASGSGPLPVVTAWMTAFAAIYPEAHLHLVSTTGSGAAQEALWATPVGNSGDSSSNRTLWGMGDASFPNEAYAAYGDTLGLQQLPASATSLVVVHSKDVLLYNNLGSEQNYNDSTMSGQAQPPPPLPHLNMTMEVLAAIFNGTITMWNDDRIAALNTHTRHALPAQPISAVVRSDSSGQTSIFTAALRQANPASWPDSAVGKLPDWPLEGPLLDPSTTSLNRQAYCRAGSENDTNGTNTNTTNHLEDEFVSMHFAAPSKTGVAQSLLHVPYSIGYLERGYYQSNYPMFLCDVHLASTANPTDFVQASPESLSITMDGLSTMLNPQTLNVDLASHETPPGGYPMAGYAYWYIKKNAHEYTSCYQAWLLCQFISWAYTNPQAATIATNLGFVPPPPSVSQIALERLHDVQCLDETTGDIISALSYIPEPYRVYETDNGDLIQQDDDLLAMILVTCLAAAVVVALLVLYAVYKKRRHDDSVWKIKKSELIYSNPPESLGQGTFGQVLLAEYRGTQVAVKKLLPPKRSQMQHQDAKTSSMASITNGANRTNTRGFMPRIGELSTRDATLFEVEEAVEEDEEEVSEDGSASSLNHMEAGSRHKPHNSSNKEINSKTFAGSQTPSDTSSLTDRRLRNKRVADFVKEMRILSKLRHPCIITIMGGVISSKDDALLVLEYMGHGSLYDVLHNDTLVLEGEMILPLLRDIAQGMRYLHATDPVIIHGDLKAANVLVDRNFRGKISDFGLTQKGQNGQTGTPFWMAPELLRRETKNTKASDVYSFGILLFEVYSRKDPYEGEDANEVLRLVADKMVNKRPPVPQDCPSQILSLLSDCLHPDPDRRPSFDELDKRLKRAEARYIEPAQNLRSSRLFRMSKQGSGVTLTDIFPEHIAKALMAGHKPEPEHHEVVTIFFSDIVGFTTISSSLEPRKVANLLDRLYNKFDELSVYHDIFKVETIGDAYMAVTNLVKDQSSDHAKRIANFALDAIKAANSTWIDTDDMSKGTVNIRCGFHTGPVVADVVGNRNPRFCLFGDTVNTASRMESNSKENRVHCSRRSARALREQCPNFPIKSRGKIHIKGKGEMHTYWVNEDGKGSFTQSSRLDVLSRRDLSTLLELDSDHPSEQARSGSLKMPSRSSSRMNSIGSRQSFGTESSGSFHCDKGDVNNDVRSSSTSAPPSGPDSNHLRSSLSFVPRRQVANRDINSSYHWDSSHARTSNATMTSGSGHSALTGPSGSNHRSASLHWDSYHGRAPATPSGSDALKSSIVSIAESHTENSFAQEGDLRASNYSVCDSEEFAQSVNAYMTKNENGKNAALLSDLSRNA